MIDELVFKGVFKCTKFGPGEYREFAAPTVDLTVVRVQASRTRSSASF